jgi:DNA-binding IscR family transcriptional regulator
LPLWRIDERVGNSSAGGVRLGLSLALLAALTRAQRSGTVLTTQALATELGVATTVIDEHMEPLAAAGFVAHTQAGSWVLAWNPEAATLRDLYDALHLPFAGSWLGDASAPWQLQIEPAVERIVRAEAAATQMTIASLIGEAVDGTDRRASVRPRSTTAIAEQIGSR